MNKRFYEYIKDKKKESYTIEEMEDAFVYATKTARSCVWQKTEPQTAKTKTIVIAIKTKYEPRIKTIPTSAYEAYAKQNEIIGWTYPKALFNNKKQKSNESVL
jgi:hypothetical protein